MRMILNYFDFLSVNDKKIGILLFSVSLLTGCSNFSRKQAPAPVYGRVDSAHRTLSKQHAKLPTKVVTTAPVKVVQEALILKQEEVLAKPQPESASVVVALLSDADISYQQGHLNESVATLERALHIEPRNALLLYKLATLRLQQGQPELAENLAKKSALLAEGNRGLKKQNWLLIAQAREQLGNQVGADAARKKAQQF